VILGIDPGPEQSGYVMLDGEKIKDVGVVPNDELIQYMSWDDRWWWRYRVAIEMIASYGMPVGADVFRTCIWIGRFIHENAQGWASPEILVTRIEVKSHLCHNSRAKDANIRQALIDRLGPPGTKAAPGPTYGVKSHAWAALAVAVTAQDQLEA
jgi:hypothetical protein